MNFCLRFRMQADVVCLAIVTQCRSIAKSIECFQRRLFVCVIVWENILHNIREIKSCLLPCIMPHKIFMQYYNTKKICGFAITCKAHIQRQNDKRLYGMYLIFLINAIVICCLWSLILFLPLTKYVNKIFTQYYNCLLYTSDAADE